jgi:hypothetical protein
MSQSLESGSPVSVCYRGTVLRVYWWRRTGRRSFQEVRNAIAEAVDALRPITADEVTDKEIIPAGVEVDEDEDLTHRKSGLMAKPH